MNNSTSGENKLKKCPEPEFDIYLTEDYWKDEAYLNVNGDHLTNNSEFSRWFDKWYSDMSSMLDTDFPDDIYSIIKK